MAILKNIGCSGNQAKKSVFLSALNLCLLIAVGLVHFSISFASAQELTAPEYKVKAAYLYNFAKLTEWPTNSFATTNSPLVIGVLGSDPFGSVLEETVKGRTIENRRIFIERFDRLDEVRHCHLLFISTSESTRMASILARLAGRPILTVGETGQFAQQGGAIGFVKQGDEVHFEVNLDAVQTAKLKLSSKLLRLAEIVRSNPPGRKN